MRTMGEDFAANNKLTAKQIDALEELRDYDRGEIDPKTIIPARTLTSLVKRGLVDDQGITGIGYDVLVANS